MPISSSSSGQCRPYPAPLICTLARSAGVPCARPGYQPTVTAMVRPSSRSTDTVSSVTVTLMILGRVSVTTAEDVPYMFQGLQMRTDNALEVTSLSAALAVIGGQRDVGIQPEF